MTDLVKSSPVSPARLASFEILLRVEEGAYASVLLSSREEELNTPDRGLCHELVMGVLRWQLWLDRLIEYYADRKASELDVAIRVILRLGLYQLRFLSRIPDSAAVNESVNLVKFARLRSAGDWLTRCCAGPRANARWIRQAASTILSSELLLVLHIRRG